MAPPPPVDLAAERRDGEFVRELIADGLVTAVHDISDGGAAGRAGRDGAGRKHRRRRCHGRWPTPAWPMLFGEDQGRYLVDDVDDDQSAF